MSGWRPALRMARRSIGQHKGRSILVAALVGLPIAAATVMNGLLETTTGEDVLASREIGGADAIVEVTPYPTLPDWRPGWNSHEPIEGDDGDSDGRDPARVDVAALLPEGTRVVPNPELQPIELTNGDKSVRTDLVVATVGDPLTHHRARVETGMAPDGPDEAMVTESLADRLGILDGDRIRSGATLSTRDGTRARVTGVVVDPRCLSCEQVVAPHGTALYRDLPDDYRPWTLSFLTDLPAGTDEYALGTELAKHGVSLSTKQWRAGGNPSSELDTIGPVALVAGIGLVEVVLLAGAAFAVGARRQVRELGLITATGGTTRHIRRVVLAQGIVLGTLGAAAGVLIGVLACVLGTPLWQLMLNRLIEDWRFSWLSLIGVMAIGLVAGLAAALLPAITAARMNPVDALARRFRRTKPTTRLRIGGAVLTAAGLLLIVVAGILSRQALADYNARVDAGNYTEPAAQAIPTTLLVAGSAVVLVGLIMSTPALLGVLSRLGARLSLSGRLAARDVGRHRHRTVPAIVAVLAVVTGSVTLAYVFNSDTRDDPKTLPDNAMLVEADTMTAPDDQQEIDRRLDDAVSAATASLPDSRSIELPTLELPFTDPDGHTEESPMYLGPVSSAPPRCDHETAIVGVASPELLRLATGRAPDAETRAALDAGKVVVVDDCLYHSNGTAEIEDFSGKLDDSTESTTPVDKTRLLPAHLAERDAGTESYGAYVPTAFLSRQAAADLGGTIRTNQAVITYAATASQDDIDTALTAVEDAGGWANVNSDGAAERNVAYLATVGGAALVTLLGVGITVALSAAESRADLATLAAIGAQPRRRRAIAAGQALVIGAVGTLLGLLLGSAIGYVAVPLAGTEVLAIPWPHLAATAVVTPLLAAAVAMLSTRSRLPMVGRLD